MFRKCGVKVPRPIHFVNVPLRSSDASPETLLGTLGTFGLCNTKLAYVAVMRLSIRNLPALPAASFVANVNPFKVAQSFTRRCLLTRVSPGLHNQT